MAVSWHTPRRKGEANEQPTKTSLTLQVEEVLRDTTSAKTLECVAEKVRPDQCSF